MLQKLDQYTKENALRINTDKTKCIVFNKTGRLMQRNFCIDGKRIETVKQDKYLGFLVTSSGEMHSGLKDLKSRAQRAIAHLRTKMGIGFHMFPNVTEHLFDSLIKPILLYMSDI